MRLGLVNRTRFAILIDGDKYECALGNQKFLVSGSAAVNVGIDLYIHRGPANLCDVGEYAYEIPDVNRLVKTHCVDCDSNHATLGSFGSNHAAGNIHL